MTTLTTVRYERTGRVARIVLNRPAQGNALTFETPAEIAAAVELANLDPAVHVIALSGAGKGFCSGYDLASFAEQKAANDVRPGVPAGSPLDPRVQRQNHRPDAVWDPMIDYAMMSRNVRAFMTLFRGEKPVLCKIHGFCIGGGTDLALCADLLIVDREARIGYPPARVWGVPATALWVARVGVSRARRLLFTGDLFTGLQALEWGLASDAAALPDLDERFETLVDRVSRLPINQLVMMKLLINQALEAQGLACAQLLGTVFDGIARHTPEGYRFQQRAEEAGFRRAIYERDEPFGDAR